ncbi:hypothetical protein RclHR1_17630002 [Rhizophagus clarus]|uniref:Uncharacterized protein n=1 Tax=Rhizophagus clarus TaxID=94130 RepID=A0A2Z6RDA6_9GLOM|nr:hypothetical protein RclHR1_17630002 [Rhizophagus clarus]
MCRSFAVNWQLTDIIRGWSESLNYSDTLWQSESLELKSYQLIYRSHNVRRLLQNFNLMVISCIDDCVIVNYVLLIFLFCPKPIPN